MLTSTQYNPDVLTCLANLSSDEVFTPPKLANEMLDTLPSDIWSNPEAKFLDPCCKSGIFLREIAKRLLTGLEDKIPDHQQRINHIFKNQLYGIAITELTALISRRSLYCSKIANSKYSVCDDFDNVAGNIRYVRKEHTWKNGKCMYCGASKENYKRDEFLESHAYEFIHTNKPDEIFNMKFDVIIGNPPYQLSSGGFGAQASPIYHLFIKNAKKINSRFLCMVIPARWFDGGMGLSEFRQQMINDRHIKKIVDCPKLFDVFPGVEIKGGVCYFLRDLSYDGDCDFETHVKGNMISSIKRDLREGDGVVLRNNEALPLLQKVKDKEIENICSGISSINPFGFPTNFKEYSRSKTEDSIEIYFRGGKGWVLNSQLKDSLHLVKRYKVITPKAGDGHGRIPMKVIGDPISITNNSVCTMTYIVLGDFESKKEADNFCLYMKTKFVRFLVSLRKSSQNVSRDVFKFVPKLDMHKVWTDNELYLHFGFNKQEVKFVEDLILEMK